MNVNQEAYSLIDVFNSEEDINEIEIDCKPNTTAAEFIEMCDILRQEGYESTLRFARSFPDEELRVWIHLEKI